jgi:uncharacterized protein (DUF488 family)
VIYTVGHSNRTADAFVELLEVHGIRQIADIRTTPYSRRHPHFGKDALEHALDARGIGYRHFPELGGRRRPRADSANTAWQHPGFRGYADYMQTGEFEDGLVRLLEFTKPHATALMCAESVWWQCHRRLLSDALTVRGIAVRHILSSAAPKPHELSEFAMVDGIRVTYPGLLEA